MTTDYIDRESSKKKYIAPLVVIMLCAVAMTGAAYAYNTSVEGYGDIKGDYSTIDLYADDGCGTATAIFKGDASSFKVYTHAVNTVDATGTVSSTYNAYVESCNLVFSAYVKIQTSLGTTENPQYFVLGNSSFTYKAPANTGTLIIDDTTEGGQLSATEIKFYGKNETTGVYNDPVTKLKGNVAYKVEITLPVTGDVNGDADPLEEDNYLFGTYTTSDAAIKAVNAFNKEYSYELTITIGVTEKPAPVPF